MRTFAQKQKSTQQIMSTSSARHLPASLWQNSAVRSTLDSQRQIIRRVLHANTQSIDANQAWPKTTQCDVSKLGEVHEPLADVTQGGAPGSGTSSPAPAAPTGGGTPAKKAELKSGPTYTPSGTIKATASGGKKNASFKLAAEFKDDPSKGIHASAGEVRQYILWTSAADMPNHAGFTPKGDFKPNTWYEDRDGVGKRYGHRTGGHAECISINQYKDTDGTQNCATGPVFDGLDTPVDGSGAKTGKWKFKLKAIDTANSNKKLGSLATVTVDW